MILPTEVLKGMVDAITKIKRSNSVTIKFMIRNKQNLSFSIDDSIVDTISFRQDFANNTTDDIQISANMNANDVQNLVANQTDLFANLVIEYVDNTSHLPDLKEPPLTLTYKVFVHDLSSLTKKFGVKAFENTDGTKTRSNTQGAVYVQVDMQLITDTEYNANRASFTGMIRKSNVEDTMKYMTSVMGIKKMKMVPSDNPVNFQHMIIPPEHSNFRASFDYIQKKFGIYANGFRHYMTNGTLYVYPPFDMHSTRTPKLHIIRVSENTYHGCLNYHKPEDNGDLTIISNTRLESKSLSNVGSENDGNTKLFVRSDGVFDGQVDPNKMTLTNITASMSNSVDASISKGSAVSKYVKPTLNLLDHASKFSESDTELMSFGWMYARINSIEPGMPTVFIFDEKNTVMSKTGIVESVMYRMTRVSKNVYNTNATLVIRSDPKPINYQI